MVPALRRSEPLERRWPRVPAIVEQRRAAGGTVLHEVTVDGRPDHIVMLDPEGNEFCVL